MQEEMMHLAKVIWTVMLLKHSFVLIWLIKDHLTIESVEMKWNVEKSSKEIVEIIKLFAWEFLAMNARVIKTVQQN